MKPKAYKYETNVVLSIWSPAGGALEGVLIPTASRAGYEN